jgi:diguanylate cyclase (GGDEF)-like protein
MGDELRDGDVIARLAGDEFVVLAFTPVDRPGIDWLVDGLHRAAARPVRYRGADICVTASIGVTMVHADDTRDALELLSAADEAMYDAKASGRGLTRYAL